MIYGTPAIQTNGLVLSLDAANTKSYPKSGTTWTDLSGNSNNGTLTNGPIFNSINGGNFVFDGIDDYINFGNIGNYTSISYTIDCFVYPQYDSAGFGLPIMAKISGCSTIEFNVVYGRVANKFSFLLRDDIIITSNNAYPKNKWYHVIITRNNNGDGSYTNILYVNGLLDTSQNNNFAGTGGSGLLSIGSAINCTAAGYFIGNIAISRIYNRALSAQEVLQNYNALKSRFNLN
jgi:hypothetical protein